jgi:hypothetical protein
MNIFKKSKLINVLKNVGFQLKEKDVPNKMFFIIECSKTMNETDINKTKMYSAKACVYKKR